MPIYEYRCERGHTFEVMQSISEDPLSTCSTCQSPVQRIFHPVAVHFKGSGFYTTDYRRKPSRESSDTASDSSKDGSKDKGSSESKASASSSED